MEGDHVLLAQGKTMRAPYPPLWQEHNDPTGQLALIYSVPGGILPYRDDEAPLSAREGESERGPFTADSFVQSWAADEMEVLVDVDTFQDTMLMGNRRGIAFRCSEKWALSRVKQYFNMPRRPNASGRPVAGQSQMPIIVGPFVSLFRPRCIANFDSFPDLDVVALRNGLDNDMHFGCHRLLGFMWANTAWYRTRYNRWVMVESGHVNVFVAYDLTADERRAFEIYGREYPAELDTDKVRKMEIKGRGIIFFPPGCRYKVVFYKDSLLSIGDLPIQHCKNSLPKLPTRYNTQGAAYEKDMERPNCLAVCMKGSDDNDE